MCRSCAIISRDSTCVCSVHDFPYNTHNKKSRLKAAPIIREWLVCRHAVAKVWLLFESAASIREWLLFDCGFYLRAAFMQDFAVPVLGSSTLD